MKRFLLVILSMIVVSAVLLGSCAEPAEPATPVEPAAQAPEAEPIVLVYGSAYPEGVSHGASEPILLDKIEKETNGRVKFEKHMAGTLIGEKESYNQIAEGICDIGHFELGFLEYGNEVQQTLHRFQVRVFDREMALDIFGDLQEKFPEIGAEASKIKVLGEAKTPAFQWLGVGTPLRTLADMEGQLVGSVPQFGPPIMRFGGNPTAFPAVDLYTALQKRTVDALTGAFDMLAALQLAEVCESVTFINLGYSADFVLGMNWDAWNSLPADVQKVFEDNYDYLGYVLVMEEFDKAIEASWELVDEYGIEVFYLSEEEQEELYQAFDEEAVKRAEAMDAKGIPGTEIWEETQRLMRKYGALK